MGKRTRKTILQRLKAIECTLQGIIDACSEPVSEFTAFNISTLTGEACFAPDLSPFDLTYYHNGAGALPAVGDIIYTDAAGLSPLVTVAGEDHQLSDTTYVETALDGTRVDIFCK